MRYPVLFISGVSEDIHADRNLYKPSSLLSGQRTDVAVYSEVGESSSRCNTVISLNRAWIPLAIPGIHSSSTSYPESRPSAAQVPSLKLLYSGNMVVMLPTVMQLLTVRDCTQPCSSPLACSIHTYQTRGVCMNPRVLYQEGIHIPVPTYASVRLPPFSLLPSQDTTFLVHTPHLPSTAYPARAMGPSDDDHNIHRLQQSDKSDVQLTVSEAASVPTPAPRSKKGFRFWMVFLAVCVSLFLSALELVSTSPVYSPVLSLTSTQTAVGTALPTIIHELGGEQYIWVASAYALASTALLPASGGFAQVSYTMAGHRNLLIILIQIFGRRITMLASLGLFALGSALCGAAQSLNWLIAARSKSHWVSQPSSHTC